ncbi:hypothetical protein AeMF1_003937, partial [Aphanomyces euteiches]
MGVTKVERIRLPSARASCTRWSVVYNIIFVLNLASTPFMAYLAEPRPGGVVSNMPPTWSTFDEYVQVTATYFQQLYNNETMGFHQISRRDFDTNTFAIRHEMTLPFEISKGDIFKYLIRMPGFFGNGIRNLISSFLTSNETSRQRLKPWQMCQHNRLLSLPYSQMCLWIVQGTEANQYTVWLASHIDESIETCWIKFVLRVILALYILYLLWTRYYCHYKTLLSNLRQLGFSPEYIRYEVVVGDPAYAILSDPVVSLAMVLDIWIGSGYVTLSLIRVTQFHDVSMYISGCMYLSRFVWFAYLGMRALSSLIKWRRWEASYAPVDPAFLAICTYLYNGPGMTLFCTTKMVLMFYDMALHFQPAYLENQAIEAISAIASMSFLMSILPFIYSRLSKAYSRCKSIYRVRPMGSRLESIKLSQFSYNDVKARPPDSKTDTLTPHSIVLTVWTKLTKFGNLRQGLLDALAGLSHIMSFSLSIWCPRYPFMAYLSEPPPGGNRANTFSAWNSFEEYVNGTAVFLQTLYNNETMEINTVGCRDSPTNSFVIQYTMTLPFEIPNRNAFDYYIRMPGAGLYSNGVRKFATNFLTSNETKRDEMQPWRMCQHERLLSMTYGELCLWMVKESEPTQYAVWGAVVIHESSAACWSKFALRCLISIYICYVLWTCYYCHYIPLLSNLQQLGVKPEYVRYEVVVGDPLYTIFCDPLVVTAVVIDSVWGTG